jgi:hypothetical protein
MLLNWSGGWLGCPRIGPNKNVSQIFSASVSGRAMQLFSISYNAIVFEFMELQAYGNS